MFNKKHRLALLHIVLLMMVIPSYGQAQQQTPRRSVPRAAAWKYKSPLTLPKENVSSEIPTAVRNQILGLYSSEALNRKEAAHALGGLGAEASPAVPYLIQLLVDDSPVRGNRVIGSLPPRNSAIAALAKIGAPAAPPLIEAIRSEDPDVRNGASHAISGMGKVALGPLTAALASPDKRGRRDIVEALARLRTPLILGPVMSALRDEDPEVRSAAAAALAATRDARAVEPLIAALKDDSPSVRSSAARSLGSLKSAFIISLTQATTDNEGNLAARDTSPSGVIDHAKVVDALTAATMDEDESAACSAIAALGYFGEPAVAPLVAALKNAQRGRVSLAAEEAIEHLREDASPALLEALKDEDSRVRDAAIQAFRRMSRLPIARLVEMAIQGGPPGEAAEAVLRDRRQASDIPQFVELLAETDPRVRARAVELLGNTSSASAMDPLLKALQDADENVRYQAAFSLANRHNDIRSLDTLAEALREEDLSIRRRAVFSLGRLGGPQAGGLVMDACRDSSGEVRAEAVRLLGFMKEKRAVPLLIAATKDSDFNTRLHAVNSLGKLADARAMEPLGAMLDEPEPIRSRAEIALRLISCASVSDKLTAASKAQDAKDDALLEELAGREYVDCLVTILDEGDMAIRASAARLLGKIGDPRATDSLVAAMARPQDIDIRIAATLSLGDLRGEEAVDFMIGMLRLGTEEHRAAVAGALRKITGKDFGADHDRWAHWWQSQQKKEKSE